MHELNRAMKTKGMVVVPVVRLLYANPAVRSHIFDGVTVTGDTAAFQLCDLHDPMLKEMVEGEEDLRETCNASRPVSSVTMPTDDAALGP